MFAMKQACQRIVLGFYHDAFSHPLPKLGLRGPKLLAVSTDNKRCFLLAFLFLVLVLHVFLCSLYLVLMDFGLWTFDLVPDTPLPWHELDTTLGRNGHTVPRGEASLARQHQVVKVRTSDLKFQI